MDRTEQREHQYLALPTAASVVHIRLVGAPPDPLASNDMRKTLEDVAHSLATFAPIYAMDDFGVPVQISLAELVDGKFTRGAHVFVTRTGKEYRRLVVQRGEMETAIALLKTGAKQRPRRILIIDDASDAALSLSLLLEAMAHAAAYVTEPAKALAVAKTFRPDIAFIDLTMPDLDGYHVAQLFRAEPELRMVTLIAISGHGLPDDRARTRKAGFDAHMLKPTDAALIESILTQFDAQP